MIIGTGIDIIEVDRIRRSLERHGARFIQRVFTPEEQALAPTGPDPGPFYAGRWAAKEAVAKTFGTGIGAGCSWTDICVLRDAAGKPYIEMRGTGARTAAGLKIGMIHVSISHIKDYACASAVAESAHA